MVDRNKTSSPATVGCWSSGPECRRSTSTVPKQGGENFFPTILFIKLISSEDLEKVKLAVVPPKA